MINNSTVTTDKAIRFTNVREIIGIASKRAPKVGRNTAKVNKPKKFELSNFYPFLKSSNKAITKIIPAEIPTP